MLKKGYKVDIFEERFLELGTNPKTGKFDVDSITEVKGGLQGEIQGLYTNLQRPTNPQKVDLDFQATDVKTGKPIFVDIKSMIDFQSLADEGREISYFPDHKSVAFTMGKKSVQQKNRFIGVEQGPKSPADVLHVFNFENIRNSDEKLSLVEAVLNGAEQEGWTDTDGMYFLNYN